MSELTLKVVAGRARTPVGTIVPREGMLTSEGRVAKVTAKTVTFEDGTSRRNLVGVTVRHSEAIKYGYPYGEGCCRANYCYIQRNGQTILA